MDRQILKDYFGRKQIGFVDLERIYSYRSKCVASALQPIITKPHTSYSEHWDLITELYPEIFEQNYSGKKVIELGPGANPLAEKFLNLGASEYIGAEAFHPELSEFNLPKNTGNAKIVNEDGLSYLLKQEDNSGLVVSFGVICPELIVNEDYFRFLGREIYRVTPQKSITIHSHGFSLEECYKVFQVHGFSISGREKIQLTWKNNLVFFK